ncbi:MAG: hypothetical protein Q7R62_00185 [bacterium]|nr:hypothetical protein [bacterium]
MTFVVVLALTAVAPAAQAAALPPTLATSWSQLLSTVQVKLSGMSVQIGADQSTLNAVTLQLMALRTQLNMLATTTDATVRAQILANADLILRAMTTQVNTVAQRWQAFSDFFKNFTPAFIGVVTEVRAML